MKNALILAMLTLIQCGCTEEYSLKSKAEELVKAGMRDPDSAKFQDVHVGPNKYVCGQVNSKNGYGGYVGYRKFIVTIISDYSRVNMEPTEQGFTEAEKAMQQALLEIFIDSAKRECNFKKL